ncbi:MAG TPA: peptidoglycan-associated lipoprotein Pal [Caulobacteraceae bacterium]
MSVIGLAAAVVAACASHPPPPPQPPTPPPQSEQGPPPPPQANEAPPPPPSGPVAGSAQDFVINVGELVYFDFDKSDVRADAQPVLAAQASWLQRYPDVKVRIEGNCDERGTRDYNFALGARRAESVREFLIAHGVADGRITTISYGKERPTDPGTGEAAWAKNRNARTAIVADSR